MFIMRDLNLIEMKVYFVGNRSRPNLLKLLNPNSVHTWTLVMLKCSENDSEIDFNLLASETL